MTGPGTKKNTTAMGYMIQERLKARVGAESGELTPSLHPDEDTISAFVEARLATDESAPVVSHLISCGICRRATAELVRLEAAIEGVDEADVNDDENPGRLRVFLDELASRIIPSGEEDVVFAYQNPETEEADEAASKSESTDSTEFESNQK